MNIERIPPERRHGDEEDASYTDRRRKPAWSIAHSISIEGMMAIVLGASSAIYAFAFLTARVEATEKDSLRIIERMDRHDAHDAQDRQQLDLRLQGIEQRLDTLIGRTDGAGKAH
jgi:hypothetical protein